MKGKPSPKGDFRLVSLQAQFNNVEVQLQSRTMGNKEIHLQRNLFHKGYLKFRETVTVKTGDVEYSSSGHTVHVMNVPV